VRLGVGRSERPSPRPQEVAEFHARQPEMATGGGNINFSLYRAFFADDRAA
jgi:hypothetical protein